jgi:hypothetical protein
MRKLSYLFATWLMAQLLFPVCFYTYMGIKDEPWDAGDLPSVLLFGFLFSLPALLLCLLFLPLLGRLKGPDWLRVALWLLLLAVSIESGLYFLVLKLGGPGGFFHVYELGFPAILAAWISVLVRLPSLYSAESKTRK